MNRFVLFFALITPSLVYGSQRFVDGKIEFATKKINGEYVYSANDENSVKSKFNKKNVSIEEDILTGASSDEIFISTSVVKFSSLSEFKYYLTKDGIKKRILLLLDEKKVNEHLDLSNIDIDSQLAYLKQMYISK